MRFEPVGPTDTNVPDLMRALEAALANLSTHKLAPSIDDANRARLLQELADLSVDPEALDREAEIDIWGFHHDT
jgi:hypothetical protein